MPTNTTPQATVREAFNLASRDGSGLLRQRELRVAVKSLVGAVVVQ